jgi:hypothetical protein
MLVEESRMLKVSIFHVLDTKANQIDFIVLLPEVMVIADEVNSHLVQAMASYAAEWSGRGTAESCSWTATN